VRIIDWIDILVVGFAITAVTGGFVDRPADGLEGEAAIDKKKCCTLHTTQFAERWYISGTRGTARGVTGPLSHCGRVKRTIVAKMGTSLNCQPWLICS
jgi:hypothetical protein